MGVEKKGKAALKDVCVCTAQTSPTPARKKTELFRIMPSWRLKNRAQSHRSDDDREMQDFLELLLQHASDSESESEDETDKSDSDMP